MFLKNYTSNVPVSETVHNIEKVLIKCGVSGIAKEYAAAPAGKIAAITFKIQPDPALPAIVIRLPVDEEAALQALWLNYADGDRLSKDGNSIEYNARKRKKKSEFKQQAERTAWKIVQDWVEIQLSMIQMKQADFLQVFLPYVWNGKQTYYAAIKENGGVRALLPESTQ